MKRISLGILALLFLCGVQVVLAQDENVAPKPSLDKGNLESQFDYIYSVSNNFQEYKVVKRTNLDQLKSNILDSIRVSREKVSELNLELKSQKDSIASLKSKLVISESEKQVAIDAKDNFEFLGMAIDKAVYSLMMWLLIAGLIISLVFFSVQFFRSFKKIKKAQSNLEEVQEEFDQHRKNTLERERKMKRELVDAQMGKK